MKETVKFVSAKPYLNAPDEIFNKIFLCLHGRKEVIAECSEELKAKLREVPSDYLQPRLKDIKQYLDSEGIPYIEDFAGTTKV